jgi:hypothetical protein
LKNISQNLQRAEALNETQTPPIEKPSQPKKQEIFGDIDW